MVLVSILAGVAAPPLAALPAIRRGLRVDLREALEASGSAVGGQGATDRALRRVAFLPPAMQLGLRNAGRRKRRSLATAVIVALAVANLLATLALARAATEGTRTSWGDHLEDVQVSTAGALFDERAASVLRTTPGVAEAEPVLEEHRRARRPRGVRLGRSSASRYFRYRLTAGRWFSAAEERARERVAVIERNLAQLAGVDVGDVVTLTTAAGDARFRIVGMAKNQQEDGTAIYVPLTTARSAARAADGRQHLLAQDDLVGRGVRRPDHDAASRTGWPNSATRSAARSATSPSATRSPPTARSRPRSRCSAS